MDTSRLPKIQDEDRESQFGYVHGVSGPGLVIYPSLHCLAVKKKKKSETVSLRKQPGINAFCRTPDK